ncbi:SusC/RagA family TonB-linked outer membrane protein [Mucilaginibacter sp. X4EP1]|uniref:SusC/RagA family TonB-linked outer membrane protein n=1 Tax=Mucilaginibacter sp. X4EP1 TaxID=2723092 RepID=UPI002167D3BE|nr:TonB-dependent receptor [Mucilaginibacter sp. X4EP1]MCS3812836.1 TonB-linked SusC/RagA family outer membrane protein [Mucilaginibacter sp. X4EP1]
MKRLLFMLLVCCIVLGSNAAFALVRSDQTNSPHPPADISGTVKDSKGEALPGVTVKIEGTSFGTVTDGKGNFHLHVNDGAVLVFTFIGYTEQKIPFTGQTSLNVVLQEASNMLNEVVAVGYGTQKRSNVTGASSTISAKEVAKRPLENVSQALQGTVSGVAVTSTSGQPGRDPSIIIRGVNTITGGTTPLYVIDGYIGGGPDVNVNDIASIEVLKDAAATAIYGSRGSNGVVLITTKSGQAGKTVINFDAWFQKGEIPKELDLMDAYDFARSVNAQYVATGSLAPFSQQQLAGYQTNGGTDWQRAIQQKPFVQNYQLDVSGGSENVKYRVSLNYLDQPGLILNQWYKDTKFRSTIDAKLNDRMDLRIIVAASLPQSHNNSYNGGLLDPFNLAAEYDPLSPIRNPDGSFVQSAPYASIQPNPIAQALSQSVDNSSTNVDGQLSFNYHIIDGLTFTSNDVYNLGWSLNQSVFGPGTGSYINHSDYADVNSSKNTSYITSNYLTYRKTFGDHSITATALYEQSQDNGVNVDARSNNLSTYNLGYYNLALGGTQLTSSGYGADGLISYMARVNYAYKEKYEISASIRDDGSSHLTQKYSTFPSVGLSWNVGKEDFLANSPVFSNFKIRGTYGQTGNQSVGAYSSIAQISTGGNPSTAYYYSGAGGPASNATFLGTPAPKSLKWEVKTAYDLGVDMSFLKGRITFVADAYTNKVNDLLYNVPIPQYLGGGNVQSNIGSIGNKGLEFALGGTPISAGKFKWTTNFNVSMNRNKVLSLQGINNITDGFGIIKVGLPLGEFYGYKFLGTWKTNQAAQAALYGEKPGDARYADLNDDNAITSADYEPLGNATPRYSYGFINDLTYGHFTLSFMFQGEQGNQIFSQTLAYLWGGLGDMKNATLAQAVPENLWTPQNQTNNPAWSNTSHNENNSSRYVYDASYCKLKNLSLAYHIPTELLSRIKARSLEVYVSGQNLFTITKFPGYDPEVYNGNTTNDQGQEFGVIPNPRTFTAGFRLGL